MFCGNCGKKIQEDFKICPYCGKAISHSTSSVPGDLTAPAAPVQAAANVTARQTAPVTPVQAAANVTAEQTVPVTPVQTAANVTAEQTAPVTPVQAAANVTAEQTVPVTPVQAAANVTAGTPQGYYQQNVQSGYAYSAPVNVKKKTHPLSVILLVVGLLCIAGAAVLVFMNRGLFFEKSNVEEITEDSVLPCSFDVSLLYLGEPVRTTKYTLSREDDRKMLNDLNKLMKPLRNNNVEIDSSVFVLPPMKITLDEDAGSEYPSYAYHLEDLEDARFNVILNRSLYDLQTSYSYEYNIGDNMPRFFFFSYDSDGDVWFEPYPVDKITEFDENRQSQPFAIVDMDNLLNQLNISPQQMARFMD